MLSVELESKVPSVQKAFALARQVAKSDASVLLTGETGTGKGIMARAIHSWSPRSEKPFALISCPSIPSELLESELFGHVSGAFTGAHRDHEGRVAQAESGTLFMDEIGDLPLLLQPKLLRFLQDREYERLGEAKTRLSDVRVLAATNIDLKEFVKQGRFREDLLYRLNVIEIHLTPLRERREDVLFLARHLLDFFAKENQHEISGFDSEVEAVFESYPWPGNIRELRNSVERAAILCSSGMVTLEHLPVDLAAYPERRPRNGESLEAIEESHIRRVLATGKSMEEVARILGIDVATLWRKRKKYGIS
jgi:NtrC-family two-component system response regulator AlgB